MVKLILRNYEAEKEARQWLLENDPAKSWVVEYGKTTMGNRVILKFYDDNIAVMIKLVMPNNFL